MGGRLPELMLAMLNKSTLINPGHARAHKPGTWRPNQNDYPSKAEEFLFAHPTWCRQQAETFGEDVARMVNEILEPYFF